MYKTYSPSPKLHDLVQLYEQDTTPQYVLQTKNNQIKIKDINCFQHSHTYSQPKTIKQNLFLFSQILAYQSQIQQESSKANTIGKIVHSPKRRQQSTIQLQNEKTLIIGHNQYSFSEEQKSSNNGNLCLINESFSQIFQKKQQKNNPEQQIQMPTMKKKPNEKQQIKKSDSLKVQQHLFDVKELLKRDSQQQKKEVYQSQQNSLESMLKALQEDKSKQIITRPPLPFNNSPNFRRKIFYKNIKQKDISTHTKVKQKHAKTQQSPVRKIEKCPPKQLFVPLKDHYKETDSLVFTSEKSKEIEVENCLTKFFG